MFNAVSLNLFENNKVYVILMLFDEINFIIL